MSTGGEGGMVVFRDRDNWSRAWSFKDHGRNFEKVHSQDHPPGFRWLNDSFGSNYRMTELQASIGRFQLRKLDEWVANRQRLASVLDSFFDGCSLLRQAIPPENIVHARYKYYTYIKTEELKTSYSVERVIGEFSEYGIPCSSGSCSEIYREKAFVESGFVPEARHNVAKELGETSLVFLVDPTLTEDDMSYICDASVEIFRKAAR